MSTYRFNGVHIVRCKSPLSIRTLQCPVRQFRIGLLYLSLMLTHETSTALAVEARAMKRSSIAAKAAFAGSTYISAVGRKIIVESTLPVFQKQPLYGRRLQSFSSGRPHTADLFLSFFLSLSYFSTDSHLGHSRKRPKAHKSPSPSNLMSSLSPQFPPSFPQSKFFFSFRGGGDRREMTRGGKEGGRERTGLFLLFLR